MNIDMADVPYCGARGGDGYQCAWDHTCFGDVWGHHSMAPRVGVEESQTDLTRVGLGDMDLDDVHHV